MSSNINHRYRFPDGTKWSILIGDYGVSVHGERGEDEQSSPPVSFGVLAYDLDSAFDKMRWMCKNRKRFIKYILRQRKMEFGNTIPDAQIKFPELVRLKPAWKVAQARNERLALESKPKKVQLELDF